MGKFTDFNGVERHFANAGGIRTHYVEAGQGEPVVLVHGGGPGADGWSNWYKCLPLMASHVHAIAVDMIGFGETDKPDPDKVAYSQEMRVRHLIDFIDALKLGPVTIAGNSMGGCTAIGAAVERPDLVRRLVLMGSAGVQKHVPPGVLPLLNYDFTREGLLKFLKGLTTPHFTPEPEMVDYRFERSLREDVRRAFVAIAGWVKQNGLYLEEDYIRRVSQPTLIVTGKDDQIAPPEVAFRFLELIPNSWCYIIHDCGHWAMLERPEDFSAATLNFIRESQIRKAA